MSAPSRGEPDLVPAAHVAASRPLPTPRFHRWLVVVLVAACLASNARADDASAGIASSVPQARPPDGVRANAVALRLGDARDNRTVTLELAVTRRRSDRSLLLRILPFGWQGEAEPYPDRQFLELRAELDGRPVAPRSQVLATFDGVDITGAIAAARIDPFAIAATPPPIVPIAGAVP